MALLGTRVEAMHDGENAMAVKTDVLVDPQSGVVLERKTVMTEVVSESGEHKALLVGQKTTVAAMPTTARPQQYRAVDYGQRSTQGPAQDNSDMMFHVMCCLLSCFFPPILCCWIIYCCAQNND